MESLTRYRQEFDRLLSTETLISCCKWPPHANLTERLEQVMCSLDEVGHLFRHTGIEVQTDTTAQSSDHRRKRRRRHGMHRGSRTRKNRRSTGNGCRPVLDVIVNRNSAYRQLLLFYSDFVPAVLFQRLAASSGCAGVG